MGELYSRHVIDLTAVAFHLTHMRELRKLLSAMLREAVQCHKVWSIIMTTLEHVTRDMKTTWQCSIQIKGLSLLLTWKLAKKMHNI